MSMIFDKEQGAPRLKEEALRCYTKAGRSQPKCSSNGMNDRVHFGQKAVTARKALDLVVGAMREDAEECVVDESLPDIEEYLEVVTNDLDEKSAELGVPEDQL